MTLIVNEHNNIVEVTEGGSTTELTITNISLDVSGVGTQGIPGEGVPIGGTINQGLLKNSSDNYDTSWQDIVNSVNTRTGDVTLDKTDVGLNNVDNTSDINKPISNATQTALDTKVDENPAITGATKTKITYDSKGLITAGANADISDITGLQTALDAKLDDTQLDTDSNLTADSDSKISSQKAIKSYVDTGLATKEGTITAGTTSQYYRGDKTFQTLNKSAVGLGNVDNTSDANKPISSATQTALNGKLDTTLKGANSGLAELDGAGKVPSTQLPAIAITEVYTVNSEAQQLALIADEGDVAIRTDLNKSFIHNGGTAGTMADWNELLTPTDLVLSVNTKTGAVTLDKTDIGLGNVDDVQQIPMSYLDTDTTLSNDSDSLVATQKATKGYVDTSQTYMVTNTTGTNGGGTLPLFTDITGLEIYDSGVTITSDVTMAMDSENAVSTEHAVKTYVDTGLAGKEDSLGFTPEDVLNKDTDNTLASNSDTKYPSQKAIKSYVDTGLSGKEPTITAGTTGEYWRGDKTWQTLNASAVGLGNVTNNQQINYLTPQLGGNLDLNGKALSIIATAGENLVAGNLCYLKSDGKYWKASNTSVTTASPKLVIANATINADATGEFIAWGSFTTTGLTAGSVYFVGASGAITTTTPTTEDYVVRPIGTASSTTVLEFNPSTSWISYKP